MILKLRIKNNYLISFAFIGIIGIVATTVFGGDILFSLAEKAYLKSDAVTALTYYEKLLAEFPNHHQVPAALYKSASLLEGKDVFLITKTSPYILEAKFGNFLLEKFPANILTREERYLKIINGYPDSEYLAQAAYKLGEIYQKKGDYELAIKAYRKSLYASTPYHQNHQNFFRVHAGLNLIDVYLAHCLVDKALETLDYLKTEMPSSESSKQRLKEDEILAFNTHLEAEEFEQIPEDVAFGRVTFFGTPVPGVQVIYREIPSKSNFYMYDYNEYPAVTTDMQGIFQIPLNPNKFYDVLGVKLDWEGARTTEGKYLQVLNGKFFGDERSPKPIEINLVDCITVKTPKPNSIYDGGPLEISFEPYKNAVYYRISFSSRGRFHNRSAFVSSELSTPPVIFHTKDTELVLKPEDLDVPQGAVSDEYGLLPYCFIGNIKSGSSYTLEIIAYDENGQILANNHGLYVGTGVNPKMALQKGDIELLEEEKLLLERNIDKAEEILLTKLTKDPKDTLALKTLARIYALPGTAKTQYANGFNAEELRERLVLLNPSTKNLYELSTSYSEPKKISLFEELVKRDDANSTVFYQLAHHYLWEEDDFEKALDYYAISQSFLDDAMAFRGYLGLYLMTGQTLEAINLLETRLKKARDKILLNDADYFKLRTKLIPYNKSSWHQDNKLDYLPLISKSFKEAQTIWKKNNTPHSNFLFLISELTNDDYYLYRDELKIKVNSYLEAYSLIAPELCELIEVLAEDLYPKAYR
ncbi:MAG: hypothetical protein PHD88_05330 [Firmicutes bacterium]|nr:hypothetical protein [Bacillota bacterium]MDD4693802.1 hypothetical protein [Bacillota bacterium]